MAPIETEVVGEVTVIERARDAIVERHGKNAVHRKRTIRIAPLVLITGIRFEVEIGIARGGNEIAQVLFEKLKLGHLNLLLRDQEI